MFNEQDLYQLWFCNIDGVGLKTRQGLIKYFLEPREVFFANRETVRCVVKDDFIANKIEESKDLKKMEEYAKRLQDRNIHITYPTKENYPKKLLEIYDAPDLLYVRGILKDDLNIYNNSIGIVGSRKMDSYGKEVAFLFAKELAEKKVTIVSGLARGIDSMAHKGALDAGGYTVAVLGCGINVTYPPENVDLYMEIENNGAIVSEYGLDEKPRPGYFPMRNRIISGLSDGLLVVQAKKKSGSLISADQALEQGKQVYAIPGRVFDINSEGTNNLIRQGAICVLNPKDIIEDLRGITMEETNFPTTRKDLQKNTLAPEFKKVYSCLSLEPMYIDDIINRSNLGVSKTISVLCTLQIQGMIKEPVKGYYIISI